MTTVGLLHALSCYATNPEEAAALKWLASRNGPGRECYIAFVETQVHVCVLIRVFGWLVGLFVRLFVCLFVCLFVDPR